MRPLIPPKWYSAVWAVLIVCSLLRNIVSIVTNVQLVVNDGAAQILLTLFVEVIFSGVLPAAICYFCALIFYYIVARRVRAFCRRDDFVYLVMAFTAAARVIMGIVESTALINSAVLSYTSLAFNSTVLTAAYFIMFFAVIKPRYLNDKTAYDSFNVFASVYFFSKGSERLYLVRFIFWLPRVRPSVRLLSKRWKSTPIRRWSWTSIWKSRA